MRLLQITQLCKVAAFAECGRHGERLRGGVRLHIGPLIKETNASTQRGACWLLQIVGVIAVPPSAVRRDNDIPCTWHGAVERNEECIVNDIDPIRADRSHWEILLINAPIWVVANNLSLLNSWHLVIASAVGWACAPCRKHGCKISSINSAVACEVTC